MIEVLGLIIAFVLIFVLRAKNVEFYASITVAAVIIGLTSGSPIRILFDVLTKTITETDTWTLSIAVALISVLGYALKETGLMVKFIEGLSIVLPSRILLATIPALFGFLSMPGGALMSAPFIDPEANRLGLKPEYKTYFNVWFRHLLYWMNPITSSTIMAVTLSGFTVNEWLRVQSPLFFVMVAIGLIASRGFVQKKTSGDMTRKFHYDTLYGAVPILVAVFLSIIGVEIWFALVIGIIMTFILGRVKPVDAVKMIMTGIQWELILSVVSMLYLRDMILTSGTMTNVFNTIISSGVPVLAIAVIIPLLIGAISGSPAMGVGIGFPLLLPLFGPPNIHLVSIVFVGITCTYITSPLHLCLVLSNSYYKSDLNRVLKYLAPSSAALYIVGILYHLVLNTM
jgi:integral membrane protein (TIGR00529 family)